MEGNIFFLETAYTVVQYGWGRQPKVSPSIK